MTVQLEVPIGLEFSLRVFDVRGRIVRDLAAGVGNAGSSTVVWDGRNVEGGLVAGGTYVARLELEGTVVSRKIVFLGPR